jgi:hypothetical protein
MAERGPGQDKRERGEGRERKERSGSGTRQQPHLELQHLITYQWKVRHINIFHSVPYTVFYRILGGNCQVFRGVVS